MSDRIYRILISSPGDCSEYRNVVRSVIEHWNARHCRGSIVLQYVDYEIALTPTVRAPTQNHINKTLVESCDLAIAIFNARLGSKTANGYPSGTVEEICQMKTHNKDVWLYFKANPKIDMSSPEGRRQSQGLAKFIDEAQRCCTIYAYNDSKDFEDMLTRHLEIHMTDYIKSTGVIPRSTVLNDKTPVFSERQTKESGKSSDLSDFLLKAGITATVVFGIGFVLDAMSDD